VDAASVAVVVDEPQPVISAAKRRRTAVAPPNVIRFGEMELINRRSTL
jgi:hypothetical protein